MIMKAALARIKKRFPIASACLALSCLITTLPQFFLGQAYDDLTGSPAWWSLSLMAFSHTPGMIVPHLLGNLCVLLSMGLVAELAIGSERFSLLSLASLAASTAMLLLRRVGECHGASGVFWGYHAFAYFLLIVLHEEQGGRALVRDAYLWLVLALSAFDFIGINALEVLVMKWRFFDNFGQVLHLVSVLIVLAYLLVRRDPVKNDMAGFLSCLEAREGGRRPFTIALVAVCLLNAAATGFAIRSASVRAETAEPPSQVRASSTALELRIDFPAEMITGTERVTDSTLLSFQDGLDWKIEWMDARALRVIASRPLLKGEKLRLEFAAMRANGGEEKAVAEFVP
jgi:membrane associated rhomboid family serine protease